MGHDIGLANSYYKPSQQELLEDYSKAVDLLTIRYDKSKLEKQIEDLKEKTEDSTHKIDSKLQRKDSEMLELKKLYLKDVKGLIEQVNAMKEIQRETQEELAELKRYRLNHMKMAFSP